MFIVRKLPKFFFAMEERDFGSGGAHFAPLERGNSIREVSIHISPLCGEDSFLFRTFETPHQVRENIVGNQDITSRSTIGSGKQTEVAVLAAGCFWGVEDILRDVPGVIDTEVGYTGGWLENPTYADTHHSKSGHAEAIRVTFDPAVLSYEELLEKWFFKLHDPTTLNRQGADAGTQYRSAIFPQTPEQKVTAERVRARVDASGKWKRPITTTIEPASTWYSAEDYHQDYLRKHPGAYSCQYMRD
jgi:methionine-S-sulfoxide reductase